MIITEYRVDGAADNHSAHQYHQQIGKPGFPDKPPGFHDSYRRRKEHDGHNRDKKRTGLLYILNFQEFKLQSKEKEQDSVYACRNGERNEMVQ